MTEKSSNGRTCGNFILRRKKKLKSSIQGRTVAEKEVLGVKMRKVTKPKLVTGSSLHFAAERKTQVNSKGCAVYQGCLF